MEPINKSAFQTHTPDIFLSFVNIHSMIDTYGIDRQLTHLVMLRASQINQCGFCVEMHTREARADGETDQRLDQTIVFKQSSHFSEKEKLALEWTERLTTLEPQTSLESLRTRLLEHYSVKELSALTALIGMINTWNRIRMAEH